MLKQICACNVYFSEGSSRRVISAVREATLAAVSGHGAVIAASFVDAAYDRSSFSLAGAPEGVSRGAIAACKAAIAHIDLRQACTPGSEAQPVQHPRVGACDHIAFYPLQNMRLRDLATHALGTADQIARAHPSMPVLLYGAVHPSELSLAAVRRSTSYFSTHQGGDAAAAPGASLPSSGRLGPAQPCPSAGALTLGCVPFVLSYNVPLCTTDLAAGRRIAGSVRERGGGLKCVEALALRHTGGQVEVATNLLDVSTTPPEHVRDRVCELARDAGIRVDAGAAYAIGLSQDELLRRGVEACATVRTTA